MSVVRVDMLCSSLTKIFSGSGDVLAGSLVINSSGAAGRAQQLRSMLSRMHALDDLPVLSDEDAVVLELRSRGYLERSNCCNHNARRLADWLQQQPAVETVYYPGLHRLGGGGCVDDGDDEDEGDERDSVFAAVARRNPLPFQPSLLLLPHTTTTTTSSSSSSVEQEEEEGSPATSIYHSPGRGCLLSIVLKESVNTQLFFDHLLVNKGPSLGSNFTLVCPYTLLAHYVELKWAASYGVSDRLIRVSVGIEDIEEIKRIFAIAIERATACSDSLL